MTHSTDGETKGLAGKTIEMTFRFAAPERPGLRRGLLRKIGKRYGCSMSRAPLDASVAVL